MSGICVIGLGSPHGDDRAGWELVRLLENEAVAVDGDGTVRFHTCTNPGAELLDYWKDATLAILVDAMRSAAPPGTMRRIELHPHCDSSLPHMTRTLSSHGLDLPGLLALATVLDALPQRLILFGIEVSVYAPLEPMSAAVRAALPGLAQAVRAEIGPGL